MNKSELSSRVAADASLSKAAADTVIDAVFSTIADALANGETVAIAGFGTFSIRARAARQGRNSQTGEPFTIAASKAPAFKAGKALRDAVRGESTRRSQAGAPASSLESVASAHRVRLRAPSRPARATGPAAPRSGRAPPA